MISSEYKYFEDKVKNKLKEKGIKVGTYKIKPIVNTGFSNIIVISIIVITIVIAIMMVALKLKQ